MSDLHVANTIKQQLTAGNVNTQKVWSWGANRWVGGANFLQFKVQAHRHKGYVKITLNSMDTYDVQLISTHGNIKKGWNGLYFDQLTETIDNEIEKVENYKF